MKILHTSDWHLGHQLYGHERYLEHESMLRRICEIVEEEKPDLFLLCGDVFHTSQPSARANKMFVDAMAKIHRASQDMVMVVTAGNHDSGSRHEVFRELWRNFGVHTPGLLHEEDFEQHIIEVPGKGFVVAMPYVHHRVLPEGFFQQLLDEVKKRNNLSLPVVMTAHTTIRNSIFSGHDDATEYSVGGIDSIDISDMGEGYDYLALGHIHRRQFPDSRNKRVRYSGTPMAVNFDEENIHTLTIVEIETHDAMPEIREIEIENPRPLITLPPEGTVDWDTARHLLKEFPDDMEAYIRLNVEVKDFLPPGAYEEACEITKNKKCFFCLINAQRKRTHEAGVIKSFSVKEFREEQPEDIFKRYVADKGFEPDEELIAMFRETLDSLSK